MNTKDTPIDYKQFEGHTPEYYIDQHLILKNTVDDEQGDIVFIMRKYADQQTESLKLELQKQKELNAELVKCLKKIVPLAEDGYVLHKRNGSHQEFLSEDKERISLAESLIKKSNEI